MTTKKTEAGPRPADLAPQAVWPPRVTVGGPVTVVDDSVIRMGDAPEGGFGVRIGKVPHQPQPRTDRTTELPTDGPGAARRAIPAPESAGTTGTIPPPAVMTSDGDTAPPAPQAGQAPAGRAPKAKPATTKAVKPGKGTRKA
jgi:hypothetical protein